MYLMGLRMAGGLLNSMSNSPAQWPAGREQVASRDALDMW